MARTFVALLLVTAFAIHSHAQQEKEFVLKKATVSFTLPEGDDKDEDTTVTVECYSEGNNGEKTPIAKNDRFAGGTTFHDPGGPYTYDIPITNPVKLSEIARLTTVITEHPRGNDRWIFNFTVLMEFENTEHAKKMLSISGNGVILDQDNRGRPFSIWVQLPQDKLDYKLVSAKVRFDTHNDDKDRDTLVSVVLNIPLNARDKIEVTSLKSFAGNERFPDPSTKEFNLNVQTPIALGKLASSELTVSINPKGHDRWRLMEEIWWWHGLPARDRVRFHGQDARATAGHHQFPDMNPDGFSTSTS